MDNEDQVVQEVDLTQYNEEDEEEMCDGVMGEEGILSWDNIDEDIMKEAFDTQTLSAEELAPLRHFVYKIEMNLT
ncbi:hypothetical protein APHAL10511_006896 [Amanita phalloides]|nr:hypothetical protein APHAL10511_006896 [Amanita phalloides]